MAKASTKKAAVKSAASNTKKAAPKKAVNKSKASAAAGSMLDELYTDCLKDIYWAEKHLSKALPKMAKAATSQELKDAFTTHTQQTLVHIQRLEQAFEMSGKKAQAKKCDAMAGLIEEGNGMIEDTKDDTFTRDCGLILAAQKVEHYEIATYGGIVALAKKLNLNDVADLLHQTLEEEKDTDLLLTDIAENNINEEALEEGGE